MLNESESIDIFQALAIIGKRKTIILLTILAVMGGTFLLSILQEKHYNLRTVLEIGRYPVSEQTDSTGMFLADTNEYEYYESVATTRGRYAVRVRTLSGDPRYAALGIVADRDFSITTRGDGLVDVALIAPHSPLAVAFMTEVNARVLEDLQRMEAPRKQRIQAHKELLSSRLSRLQKALAAANDPPQRDSGPAKAGDSVGPQKHTNLSLTKEQHPGVGLITSHVMPILTSIDPPETLRQMIMILETSLKHQESLSMAFIDSRIIASPAFDAKIVHPRPLRNTALAGVISLFAALALTFLVEICTAYRGRASPKNQQ